MGRDFGRSRLARFDRGLRGWLGYDLLRQRIYGRALGYEDLNDNNTLRKDLVWQSAVERGEELASSSTL